jgi:hypothetical protein
MRRATSVAGIVTSPRSTGAIALIPWLSYASLASCARIERRRIG